MMTRLIVYFLLVVKTSLANSTDQCVFCYQGEYCDKTCTTCPNGFYQDKNVHTETSCKPWTLDKGKGWTIEQQGTTKSDIVWVCAEGFYLFNNTDCLVKQTPDRDVSVIVAAVVVPLIITIATVAFVVIVLKHQKCLCFADSTSTPSIATKGSVEEVELFLPGAERKTSPCPNTNGLSQTDTAKPATSFNVSPSSLYSEEAPRARGIDTLAPIDYKISAQENTANVQKKVETMKMKTSESNNLSYIKLLKKVLMNIQEMVTSEEFQELFTGHLILDHEQQGPNLMSSYLNWAERNPDQNHSANIRAALESLEYILPKQSDANISHYDAMNELLKTIQRRASLTNSFKLMCSELRRELGNDIFKLFLRLSINYEENMNDKYIISLLVRWSYRQPCDDGLTWSALDHLKSALLVIRRQDLVEEFDKNADEVSRKYRQLFQ